MHRVFTAGIRGLRAEYLFPLAYLCHVPPPQAGPMRVADFAVLIDGCDAVIAARQRGEG